MSAFLLTDRAAFLSLIVILGLGLIGAFSIYSGPSPFYDDSMYLQLAHQILIGSPSFIGSIFGFDYLQLMFVALSLGAFGYGTLQAILPSILEYSVMITLAFLIGRRIRGNGVGIVSAFLTATAPFVLVYVTRVLPDMATGMAAAISVYVFLVTVQQRKRNPYMPLLFGVTLVLPLFMKMEGLAFLGFSWVAMIASAAYYRSDSGFVTKRFICLAAVGSAIALLVYFSIFNALIGNPFFGLEHDWIAPVMTPANNTLTVMNPDTLSVGPSANTETYPIGLFIYLAIAGTLVAIAKRERFLSFISIVTWGVFAYLVAGTTTYTSYVPITTHTRFFTIVVVPLAVLGAYGVSELYSRAERRKRWLGLVAACAVLFAIVLTNIPLYLLFAQANAANFPVFNQFYEAVSYITNASKGSPANVFFYAPGPFPIFVSQDLNFTTSFSQSYQIISINSTTPRCGAANLYQNAYLLNVNPINYSGFSNLSIQNDTAWLGANCTASPLASFGPESGITVYRLGGLGPAHKT